MAGLAPSDTATACAEALRCLRAGRWDEWHGLPPGCTLGALASAAGGARRLDAELPLGELREPCQRSSLADGPVLVWHQGEQICLVELDLEQSPLPAPADARPFRRLDLQWGAARVRGGEWVDAARGLVLRVEPGRRVIGALGFAPTTLEDYLARRRPQQPLQVPPQPLERRP